LLWLGTQWNEFYWKEQTVMLLMQELDFPDGKNPEFCARSFFYIINSWAGWLSVPLTIFAGG
jgi:hypothetical protein